MKFLRLTVGFMFFSLTGSLYAASFPNYAYVTNQFSRDLSVIDTSTNVVVATITLGIVGNGPILPAVSPDGEKLYVTINNLNILSVVDTAIMQEVDQITLGSLSVQVVFSPDGSKAYVTTQSGLIVINTANNSIVATIPTGKSNNTGLALSPDGSKAYVKTNYVSGFDALAYVSVIDTNAQSLITTIALNGTEQFAGYIAVTPDGTKAYVTNNDGATSVSVLDLTNNTLATEVDLGANSSGVAITPDGQKAYVGTVDGLSIIQVSSDTISEAISTSPGTYQLAFTADGKTAYATSQSFSPGRVLVIDTTSNTVTGTITVGDSPFGICISNSQNRPPPPSAGSLLEIYNKYDNVKPLKGLL